MALTPEVGEAIEQVQATFPDSIVAWTEDGDGGAFVRVDPVLLGDRFNFKQSWIGFHLTYQYPEAQVYPHYCAPGLTLADGTDLDSGAGFQQVTWGADGRTEPATQLSRTSGRWDPAVDTAAIKLQKVLAWLRG